MTPEGKVKAAVSKLLAKHKTYTFMPVPGGYGASSLDYIVCINGKFLAIETKSPGGKPTNRQRHVINLIKSAGGTALVVDGDLTELKEWLDAVCRPGGSPTVRLGVPGEEQEEDTSANSGVEAG